ncbi:MAG: acyltransferase [Gemmatimonadetes bacterium]|nr:acyltransferase [Gemmatimonadota bacterium]
MTGHLRGAERRDHVRPLTSLRFLAALWVLLHHALPRGAPGSITETVGASGWLGVSLFFVLSGFLLMLRYAPTGALRGPRRDFWLERVARLAPTYVLSLAFAGALFVRDARVEHFSDGRIAGIVASVLTVQQAWRPETACSWNCPAWSLSVESWFYLIFPFLAVVVGAWMLRGNRVIRGSAVLGLALAASAVVFLRLVDLSADWVLPVYSLSPLARWPEFLAGIALGGMLGGWTPTSRRPGSALLVAGSAWIVATILLRAPLEASRIHLLPAALPGFVLVIAGTWGLRAHKVPLLGSATLVLLGEASYALYLFHAPLHGYVLAMVNRVVGRGYDASWWLFTGYTALAIGLAVLLHLRFELPWRGRLRTRFGLSPRRG